MPYVIFNDIPSKLQILRLKTLTIFMKWPLVSANLAE